MRYRGAFLLIGLVASIASGPARAQAANDSECDDPQTQTAMNICSGEDAGRLDDQLNLIWGEASLAAKERQAEMRADPYDPLPDDEDGPWDALLKAQRGWIAYKESHCHLSGLQYYGGSIRPLIENTCVAELTQARIAELAAFINPEP